jgi:Malectin domain
MKAPFQRDFRLLTYLETMDQRQHLRTLDAGKFESVDLGCEASESTISYQDEGDWVNDFSQRSVDHELRGRDPKQGKVTCCRIVLRLIMVASVLFSFVLMVFFAMSPKEFVDYSSDEYVIRINAGASQPYCDYDNNYWLPDTELGNHDDFVVSVAENSTSQKIDVCPVPVDNNSTEGRELYCTQRSFSDEGRYEIAVPENFAAYQVDLYFAELEFPDVNQRQFDIYIENFLAVANYDVVDEAGGQNRATRFSYIIEVNDGYLSILFKSKVDSAKISGIVVSRSDTLGDR